MNKTIRYRQTVLTCLALGFVGAGGWAVGQRGKGNSGTRARATVAAPAAPRPADVLAAISPPTGNSATDLAIAKWTARAAGGGDARAWVNLGDALMQHVRDTADFAYYGHAEKVYEQALALDPKNGEAMTGLAWVHGGRHNFNKSIEWANKAVALNDHNNLAYGLLGDADVELGDYAAAFTHYQKMMDLRPDISSYSRGAHLLQITGQPFRAAWLMRQAINSGSAFAENTAWCRAQLALIYFSDGNLLAADQELADALQKTPNNRYVLAALGKIKAARKDYPEAIAYYKKAVAVTPEHETLVALGDLYALTGDKAEAEKQYATVEALHQKIAASGGTHDHMQMAQFYADHDRNLSEAVRLAEEHKTTKNVAEADILAWCYYKTNDLDRAKEAIGRALGQKTAEAKFLYHAGMIYASAGDRVGAQKYLYRALNMNPNFSPVNAPVAAATLKKLGQVAGRPVTGSATPRTGGAR